MDIIALILPLGPQSLMYLLFRLLRKSLPTSGVDYGGKTLPNCIAVIGR